MVYVPEGDFLMGSDGHIDEGSKHPVYLDAYWIDGTEVTNAMFTMCEQAGFCLPPGDDTSSIRTNYYYNTKYADYPVKVVSWNKAQVYCGWAGGRLPTEAEWEKAARGTDGRKYPWGNNAPTCSLANMYLSGEYCVGDTTPVRSYPAGASPYGALDLAGNVWEWVADWYGEYPDDFVRNPSGPSSGENHVYRGGSYYYRGNDIRSANRESIVSTYWLTEPGFDIGFRCALSTSP